MSIKAIFAAMTLKVKVLVICAAVVVTGGTAAAVGIAVTREETYRVLKVFELTGNAIVTRADSGDLDAYVGMNLESGDTLTVGEDSTLRISMDSDKYILLDSGTVLELKATGTPSDSRTSVDLKTGTILNEITNPLSANSSYEVSTPKSTMAVRGTSFMISVEENSKGVYIIRENTFQGKVEVELIDKKGNRTGKTVLVPTDKGITICTEPDESSGNPAEVDGTSRFVFEDMNGNISELEQGQSVLHEIRYGVISDSVRGNALRSNDESLMLLEDNVLNKLRGGASENPTTAVTTAASDVQAAEAPLLTQPETTAATTVPTQPETTAATTVPTQPETTAATTVPTEPETTAATTVPAEPETTAATTTPTESETTAATTTPTESETTKPITTPPYTETPIVIPTPPKPETTPTPTPIPSETPTPTPVPTETPTPTPVPSATPTPTPVPSATPSPSPVPSVSPSPTPVPTVSPSPTPVPTVSPSPTPVPTVSPSPTPVPTVSPSPSPIPTETANPDSVNFCTNYGGSFSSVSEITIEDSSAVSSIPAVPDAPGGIGTPLGWYLADGTKLTSSTVITGDTTVIAKYKVTVKFVNNMGATYDTATIITSDFMYELPCFNSGAYKSAFGLDSLPGTFLGYTYYNGRPAIGLPYDRIDLKTLISLSIQAVIG